MKVLYHHSTASKDGQAVHIEEMIHAMRELGHEVRVVAPEIGGGDMGAEAGWVTGLRDRLPKAVYECQELGYSLLAYLRLARAAREFRPVVIYERYNLYLLAGLALKGRRRVAVLLEVNAPWSMNACASAASGLPWLGRWAGRRAGPLCRRSVSW